MADDMKYGEITTSLKQIPHGEPVFILRARDMAAVPMLESYGRKCARLGAGPAHLESLRLVIARFREWQSANPTLVKVPD